MRKTYILVTVDVEPSTSKGRPLPVEKMVYGRFDGEEFGISKIMDICEKNDFKATFFVDVCPYKYYGEDEIKNVCQRIHRRGHDVELHTHPNWTRGRYWMFEYSLEEQMEIIKEGKDLIYRWVGEYPVAYRAGGFSADMNTLRALKENGIQIDSSFYPGYKRCPLTSPPLEINDVYEHDGVIELPVTVFTPLRFGRFKTYRNVDIDSCTWDELKHSIKEGRDHGLSAIVLLLHSFSFVRWNKDRTEFSPDPIDLERFEKTIELLKSDPNTEFITTRDFYRLYTENPGAFRGGKNFIPHSGFSRTFARACLRFNSGWKNKAFVLSTLIFFLSCLYMGYFLWKVASQG